MTKPKPTQVNDISTESVALFLKENPSFFNNRDDLLVQLELPHRSGGATSLVERQVSVLRERNMDMRQRFSHMLDAAKDNDRLFEKSRQLVLDLLKTSDLNSLLSTLEKSMKSLFDADDSTLLLAAGNSKVHKRLGCATKEQHEALQGIFNNQYPLCGALREGEINQLFPNSKNIKSAAAIPITIKGVKGVFAVGSNDEKKFISGMGTLFLQYIADVASSLITRELR